MTVTGEVYDEFDLIKQEDGSNILIERLPPGRTERRFDTSGETN
jgi:hypothetical protein